MLRERCELLCDTLSLFLDHRRKVEFKRSCCRAGLEPVRSRIQSRANDDDVAYSRGHAGRHNIIEIARPTHHPAIGAWHPPI